MNEQAVIDFTRFEKDHHGLTDGEVLGALTAASSTIAPVWPLDRFVAVNPYVGYSEKPSAEALARLQLVSGATSVMAPAYYREHFEKGRITEADLASALDVLGSALSLQRVTGALSDTRQETVPLDMATDCYGDVIGKRLSEIFRNYISRFVAQILDDGQASFALVDREKSLLENFLNHAAADHTLSSYGVLGFERYVAGLTGAPVTTAATILDALGIRNDQISLYIERIARDIGGWIAFANVQGWMQDRIDDQLTLADELVVIRLIVEGYCIEKLKGNADGLAAWARARAAYSMDAVKHTLTKRNDPLFIWQKAYEIAVDRELTKMFSQPKERPAASDKPAYQAAFCIDVRSEIYRRHLEVAHPGFKTIGFAGFFGIPVHTTPFGGQKLDLCPVLLQPGYGATETVGDEDAQEALLEKQKARGLAYHSFKAFKDSAVNNLGFVDALGLGYIGRLIGDSFRLSRPGGFAEQRARSTTCHHDHSSWQLTDTEGGPLTLKQRVDLAMAVLSGMGLTKTIAPMVFLLGHGASSVNNPHAAGLDCGACGGNAGAVNARLAADLLNDPQVQASVRELGIPLPDDAVFIAGQHNTTTDAVDFFDTCGLSPTAKLAFQTARAAFRSATKGTQGERAGLLGASAARNTVGDVVRRANDWSEVRPEWGLAGCKTFLAAPRWVCSDTNLEGQSFLHEYEHVEDPEKGVLELIMTAPMVVASWINLQYYGSTLDNQVFGSGNKTLHNVVGKIGVFEGNGGDLRVGLPMQSIHDGKKFVHDPVRLRVVIRAPRQDLLAVIEKHSVVADLLNNDWISLYAMDDHGVISHRYTRNGFEDLGQQDVRKALKADRLTA